MGSVYIFNFSSDRISWTLNSVVFMDVALEAASVTSQPPYSPDTTTVPLAVTQQPGTFLVDSKIPNQFMVSILGATPQNSNTVTISLDPKVVPTQDLWLYLFHTHLVMFDTKGGMLPDYPVPLSWSKPAFREEISLAGDQRGSESRD